MKSSELLQILEETVEKLDVELDYEDIRKGVVSTDGGSFLLRGKQHIIVNKKLDTTDKAEVLTGILSEFDTEEIHLPPEIRKKFEAARVKKAAKEAAAESAVAEEANA